MESERSGASRGGGGMAGALVGWRTAFFLGLITVALGVVVLFRPSQSLNVIAVLVGITMLVSGVFHVVRALDGQEHERLWRGIAGVLFILGGIVLIRHISLTIALIGLFVGFTWIIQGVASLVEGLSRGREGGARGWMLFFGVISLIAGIVVVSAPIASVTALTIFMGIWFIVMGLMEMIGSIAFRHSVFKRDADQVNVPGPRAGTSGDASGDAEAAGHRPESRNVPH